MNWRFCFVTKCFNNSSVWNQFSTKLLDIMTPTWFEHATFWSGVRRATIAPRSHQTIYLRNHANATAAAKYWSDISGHSLKVWARSAPWLQWRWEWAFLAEAVSCGMISFFHHRQAKKVHTETPYHSECAYAVAVANYRLWGKWELKMALTDDSSMWDGVSKCMLMRGSYYLCQWECMSEREKQFKSSYGNNLQDVCCK